MSKYKLSIVIPVYGKANFTVSCINDLYLLKDIEAHQIIVVDNAGPDDTEARMQPFLERENFIYARNESNYGFGKACNIGYSLSRASNILFLNNDIRVIKSSNTLNHENWTDELLKYADTHIVGPTMGQLDNKLNFIKEANQELGNNSYMSGWCLCASKNVFNRLDISGNGQIFDEQFFVYFEDTDLSFRAKELGVPLKIVTLPVVHFGKVSSKQLNTYQLYTKSREIFVNKWKHLIK